MIKFLHFADVHLGRKFSALGEKGKEQRMVLRQTFSKAVNLALEKKINLVLIAGDLFDSNQVPQSGIDFAFENLKKLTDEGIFVFLIGGTHDFLKQEGVLSQNVWQGQDKLIIFDEKRSYREIPELDLTISGISNHSNKSTRSQLKNFKKETSSRHQVLMIHGSYALPEKHAPDDFPFTLEEIEKSGVDYLALGHWHSFYEVKTKKVKAVYPGALEALDFDQKGAGNLVYGEINKSGVEIEKIKIGKRSFKKLVFDLTAKERPRSFIEKEISKAADPNLALEIVLEGLLAPETVVSQNLLLRDYGANFYLLKILDKTKIALEKIDLDKFPEELVSGQFVRLMLAKIKKSNDFKEKEILEKALQVGVAMLQGED